MRWDKFFLLIGRNDDVGNIGSVFSRRIMVLSKQDFDRDTDAEWQQLCDLAGIPKEPWNVQAFAQIEVTGARVFQYNHEEKITQQARKD